MSYEERVEALPRWRGPVDMSCGKTPASEIAAEADTRIAALQAENAELRKDAERYRWLRDIGDATWTSMSSRVPEGRRIGMMAMVGGKDKTRIRNATPPEFRDVLIGIARSAQRKEAA